MKVRVIKEMPFAKVGEVFDVIGGDTIFITIKGEHAKVCYLVCGLIEDGWVEEVHILEDKLDQIPDENCTDCIKKTVKVVKEHYLEVFDKATVGKVIECGNTIPTGTLNVFEILGNTRKAIEEA